MDYYIIGGDKEIYGPKPGREINYWIREGRLMAESRISTEDSPEWRPLSEFPEFARELKLADEEYGEVENEEYDEGDDELSFPIPWWLWVIRVGSCRWFFNSPLSFSEVRTTGFEPVT